MPAEIPYSDVQIAEGDVVRRRHAGRLDEDVVMIVAIDYANKDVVFRRALDFTIVSHSKFVAFLLCYFLQYETIIFSFQFVHI